MHVVIHVEDLGGFAPSDGTHCTFAVTWHVEGRPEPYGIQLNIAFGTPYAATLEAIRAGVVAASAEHGTPIEPDATIQIWGGPQPTLADLGG